MADLRHEINDLATRVEAAALQMQREHMAMKAIHEGLVTRAEDEAAAAIDSDKLARIAEKIAALELEAPAKAKAAPATHAKTEHK